MQQLLMFDTLILKIKLLALILLFLLIYVSASFYQNLNHSKITLQQAKEFPEIYIKYLERFKIKSFIFTIGSVSLYFGSQISIVIYLRLQALNKASIFTPINIDNLVFNKETLFNSTMSVLLFISAFILFKLMLNKLFHEVHKLRFFLKKFHIYNKIEHFWHVDSFLLLWGNLHVFFYYVSQLKTLPDPYDFPESFDYYKNIYENENIKKLALYFVQLAMDNKIIHWIFIFLELVFRFLYRHMHRDHFLFYIPYIIYFLVIFYDFLHLEIYYTLYLIFPMYLIILMRQCILFITTKNHIIDRDLAKYFYSKDSRLTRLVKDNIIINNKVPLFDDYVIKYVINEFCEEPKDKNTIQILERVGNNYKKVLVIILCMFSSLYLMQTDHYSINIVFLNLKTSLNIILVILFMVMAYAFYNTFKLANKAEEDNLAYFVYNLAFWILFTAHITLYSLFIIKPHIFIINQEIIAEYFGIQFIQYFTIEEKMKFFQEYFSYCIKTLNTDERIINGLTVYIEEMGMNNIIVESTTMSDIKVFIEELVIDYIECTVNLRGINLLLFFCYAAFIAHIINEYIENH